MGRVFESGEIERHEIPAADGTSHLATAKEVRDHIKRVDTEHGKFKLLFQAYGSTTTGEAGRRSDVDILIGYGCSPDRLARIEEGKEEALIRPRTSEEAIEQDIFRQSVLRMVGNVASAHNTKAEAQCFNLLDACEGNAPELSSDPLYIAHICESPEEWRVGDVGRFLSRYAIDITKPLSETQISHITSAALRYMALKARIFATSGAKTEVNSKNEQLRRILEFPKAAGRRTLTISALRNGKASNEADVTSKSSMYEFFEEMTAEAGDIGRRMFIDHTFLAELDAQYDEVLEGAIKSGSAEEHERWIADNFETARVSAYSLAANCYNHIDKVAFDEEVVIDDYLDNYENYRLPEFGEDCDMPSESTSAPLVEQYL